MGWQGLYFIYSLGLQFRAVGVLSLRVYVGFQVSTFKVCDVLFGAKPSSNPAFHRVTNNKAASRFARTWF